MGDHPERTPERKDAGALQPGWCGPTLPSPGSSSPGPRAEGAWPGREAGGLRPLGGECLSRRPGPPPAYPYCLGRAACLGRRLTLGGRRRRLHPGPVGSGGDCPCGPRSRAELAQVPGPGSLLSVGARSPEEAVAAARSVPDLAPAPGATLSFTAPPTPITTLGSRPTHPDSCPRAPTHGPADLSSGLPSPPSASPGPELLDPQRQALADEGLDGQALGDPEGARTLDSEPLLGATAAAPPCARPTGEKDEEQGGQQGEECPICTEPYGPSEHRLAQLNCGHGLCSGCLHRLLDMAPSADLGRVRCPLCRQKTPMLEWEICRLQEELLLADGPQRPPPPTPPAPPRRGTGPWASLEHHYQLRFLAGPVGGRGCLPFLPCPPCLGTRLWALRERGPCARRLGLLGLLGLELLGLLLTFTPLVLLGLLFMLLDRSGH